MTKGVLTVELWLRVKFLYEYRHFLWTTNWPARIHQHASRSTLYINWWPTLWLPYPLARETSDRSQYPSSHLSHMLKGCLPGTVIRKRRVQILLRHSFLILYLLHLQDRDLFLCALGGNMRPHFQIPILLTFSGSRNLQGEVRGGILHIVQTNCGRRPNRTS